MRGGSSGGRGFGGGGMHSSGGGGGGYRNPCLTMHQPWASLLVHGIKRVEGRSWPSPVTGRLWIHAASKVPDPDTVAAMEAFYREIHAVDGVAHIDFPQHYPVSRLLGCIDVVGCVRSEELVCWEDVPESVRLEGLTDFCWLCENPQKLVVPFEMRGYQGVYNLERRIYEGAVRGLSPVQGPLPVKFPLPDPRNPLSLKPGSLNFDSSKSTLVKTPSVSAAIAGARAAANQYSRKDNNAAATSSEIQTRNKSRESRADGGSGSGSLPSVVLDSPSHSQRQDPSLNFDSSKSALVNAPSVSAAIAGARAAANQYSRKDNNAAATSSEIQTRNKSRESRADGGSWSGSLPSVVLDSPSHSQRQDPSLNFDSSKSPLVKAPSVSAVIAGARAAASQYSRNDNNAAATSSEIQTRNKSREYRADGGSGSCSLPSVVLYSPSHSQRQDPCPVVQNNPFDSRNQNHSAAATSSEILTWNKSREDCAGRSSESGILPSAVQDSPLHAQRQNPLSTVQNIPSYSQNQNPVSIVGSIPIYLQSQNPSSTVHNILSYPHYQIPVSIVGSIPIYSQGQNSPSVFCNIQPYSQNQNPHYSVQSSPSCSQIHNPSANVHNSAFYSHNRNLPSVVQNSASCSHSHDPSPSVQSHPSFLHNYNPSLTAQNNSSALQNQNAEPRRSPRLQNGASNRLVAVALRELKQSSSSEGRERWVPKGRPE